MDRISKLRSMKAGSTTSINTVATATHSLSALLESSMRYGAPRTHFVPSAFPGSSDSSNYGSTSTSSSSDFFLDELDDDEQVEPSSYNLPHHPYARVFISGQDRHPNVRDGDEEDEQDSILNLTSKSPFRRAIKFAEEPPKAGSRSVNSRKKDRGGRVYQLRKSQAYLTLYSATEGYEIPIYGQGSIVEGHVAITQPGVGDIKSIEAKLEGFIRIEELGEPNDCVTKVVDQPLISWDESDPYTESYDHLSPNEKRSNNRLSMRPGQSHRGPTSLSFKAALPLQYTDSLGERVPLPPSFNDQLSGFPGFSCSVTYRIFVTLVHSREPGSLWRKRTVVQIPLRYFPRTRPPYPSPQPATAVKVSSNPVTLFKSSIKCKGLKSVTPVSTMFYLPGSQILPLSHSIPFYLRITAPENILRIFPSELTLSPHSSFHPLSTEHLPLRRSGTLARTLKKQFRRSFFPPAEPVLQISLVRHTCVDTKRVSSGCVASGGSSENQNENEAGSGAGKEGMQKNEVIGDGMLLRATANLDQEAITWRGEIKLRPHVQCGGFYTRTLVVKDSIEICVNPPETSQLEHFRQVIPVRLTTDDFGCVAATQIFDI